jgi:hypothetical protein
MPKKSSPKKTTEETREERRQRIKEELVDMLLKRAREGDVRSAEVLAKFEDFAFLTKPEAPEYDDPISERTAKRIADLAERLLTPEA